MTRRIVRLKEVQRMTGLSRSTIYAQMAKGHIPQTDPLDRGPLGRLARTYRHPVDRVPTADLIPKRQGVANGFLMLAIGRS